jgi:hypothetical protein
LQEKVKQLELQKVKIIDEAEQKFKEVEMKFEEELEMKEQTVQ